MIQNLLDKSNEDRRELTDTVALEVSRRRVFGSQDFLIL